MKGRTNNPKGRPKGKPNRVTSDLREQVKMLVEKNFEKLETDFNKLDSEKRLIILERYLKYCLPPLQSFNVQAEIRSQLETLTDDQLNDLAERIITQNI